MVAALALETNGQVPNIQVYFAGNPEYAAFYGTLTDCQTPGTVQDLYVVLNNANMWVQAVDFSVWCPPALIPTGDTAPANTLVIGFYHSVYEFSRAIAWQFPQNGYQPLLALTIHGAWTASCNCDAGPQALLVRGWKAADGEHLNPIAVRWPDFAEIEVVGMTSLVCPGPMGTAETTWGRVKALYR